MYIQASQLIGRPVALAHSDEHVGRIQELIFDPDTGRVVGLVVSRFLQKEKFLSPLDIIDISPEAVVVADDDCLLAAKDLVRAQEARQRKIPILGQRAQTRSGKVLGTIENVLLTSDEWLIGKYYIRRFLDTRILPGRAVVRITRQAVIFDDQVAEPVQDEAAQPEIATA